MVIAFDDVVIDLQAYEIRRDGERIDVEPQVFDVLAHLASHPDRVVTKEELLDEVWGSRFVSESALTSRIKSARQLVGDDGRTQRVIKTVHGRGYRFAATLRPPEPSTAEEAPRPASNLPSERTPLFGRAADIEAIVAALDDHRLVTLLGIGGIGKTRLAVAAARSATGRFRDGVWFVDLIPLRSRRDIELAIADAARLAVDDDRPVARQLADRLADRDALVVLDNAEHVAAETAALVDELLESTAAPRLLVTSRVPLNVVGERRFPVDPLAFDAAVDVSPAVRLLMTAAQRFGADASTEPTVAERICSRLDGLPLAIELAAAQLRYLDANEMADRLDERLDVLDDAAVSGERHSSLHSVLTDTIATVDSDDRGLLALMSSFPSTFALDDLVGLAQDEIRAVDRGVRSLVDRSLVVRERRGRRFRLLETVRRFARDSCTDAELAELDDRHLEWCLRTLGEDPAPALFDFDRAAWCSSHHDSLRAATMHATATGRHRDAALLTTGSSLSLHADIGPRAADALSRIADHVRGPGVADDAALRARLHLAGVMCGMAIRSPAKIAEHGEQAVIEATDSADALLRSAALVLRSWSTIFVDPDTAVDDTARAAELAAAADAPDGRDFADGYRAFHLAMLRRYDDSVELAEAVIARSTADSANQYPRHVAVAALSAVTCIHEPAAVAGLADDVQNTPSVTNNMWSNDLLAATIHASNGVVGSASRIAHDIRRRLDQAGQDPFPDLFLPPAALAVRTGELDLARRWTAAVRATERPTQSFQATIIYRRLRDKVGDLPVDLPGTTDEIGSEAMSWLADRAAASAAPTV